MYVMLSYFMLFEYSQVPFRLSFSIEYFSHVRDSLHFRFLVVVLVWFIFRVFAVVVLMSVSVIVAFCLSEHFE